MSRLIPTVTIDNKPYVELHHVTDAVTRLNEQKTLRDEFAMAALAPVMQCYWEEDCTIDEIVRDAYMFADAMLKERQNE